jgi:carnitine 3-dehydrogenase
MLQQLGMHGTPGEISFHTSAKEAVKDCQFVQECAPEKLHIKHQLYAEIEEHLLPDAIVASSASGLMVSEMQAGWLDPSRFILGHPFNPPHLIPLVELVANDKTADGVLEHAEAFYKLVGKVTIRVRREVPAHVANRLQAALWKEAIHLVESGVASVEDVDKAVWAGPGLRWAAMGPHMLFNLGAGKGGMAEFCDRYSDSFHRWWDDLGQIDLNPSTVKMLVDGLASEAAKQTPEELSEQRDALIVAMLKATTPLRESN